MSALREELFAPPWSGSRPVEPATPRTLVSADLARALLVESPELVRRSVFASEPAHGPSFDAACAAWRRAVRDVEASELESHELPLVWARRLTLGILYRPAERWTVDHLVCTTLVPEWVDLTERFHEGIVTRDETEQRLHDALASAREQGILAGSSIDPLLPEPYLERDGELRALERHLADGPGALVIGPRGSGRRSLVAACQSRHRRGEGPAVLRNHAFNLDRFYDVPHVDARGDVVLPPEMSDRCVFALVHHGVEAAVDPAAELHPAWLAALREGVRRSLRPELGFRLVLGLTPERHEAVRALLSEVDRLPTIHLAPHESRERVGVWICRIFELERRASGPVDLLGILAALAARTPTDRTDFFRLEDMARPAPAPLRRAMRQWRAHAVVLPRTLARLLDELELTPDDLRALLALEESLLAEA
ncbi:MAG: ATP-binding protein [Myxococcales bacterium]|nr:ATP-binding protein [Myxococcales bacterium]